MMDKDWFAPAKLNLFLHITGRRDDGYHHLQTLFQFLSIGDILRFHVRDDGRICRAADVDGVSEDDDLTVRAARALQAASGVKFGVEITLDKKLPLGGGLGGGSSDAATTLVALNKLWQSQFTVDQLAELGLGLGADVPVFVRGQAAWAEGVGEHMTAVDVPEPWYLVVHPGVHISTVELFASPELTRDVRAITIRDYLADGGVNVFESVAKKRYPAVAEALDWLTQKTGVQAKMTGTGSCIFATIDDEKTARSLETELAQNMPDSWQLFCAKGMNQSPLFEHDCLKK